MLRKVARPTCAYSHTRQALGAVHMRQPGKFEGDAYQAKTRTYNEAHAMSVKGVWDPQML